jgi:hypothetical protein
MKDSLTLIQYTPIILRAIKDVEGMVTTPKAGATKKDIVLAAIQTVAKDGETVDSKLSC